MRKHSAGILLYRRRGSELEVLLVHPGGPYWAKKDEGAWSIPKGEIDPGEDPLTAARREFEEETGSSVDGELIDLGEVEQSGGKIVRAFSSEGDLDPSSLRSNTFRMEYPLGSGRIVDVPEVDRAHWFSFSEAGAKMNKGQVPLLEILKGLLGRT